MLERPLRSALCYASFLEGTEPLFLTWTCHWRGDLTLTRGDLVAMGTARLAPADPGAPRVWNRFVVLETAPAFAQQYGDLLERANRHRAREPYPPEGVRVLTLDMT